MASACGRIPIRALILTPTRELAAQVEESVRTYGKYLPLTSMVMFGGVGMQPQIDRLRKGVDILVATPGRLLGLDGLAGVCEPTSADTQRKVWHSTEPGPWLGVCP